MLTVVQLMMSGALTQVFGFGLLDFQQFQMRVDSERPLRSTQTGAHE